jgi:hypothetical protein
MPLFVQMHGKNITVYLLFNIESLHAQSSAGMPWAKGHFFFRGNAFGRRCSAGWRTGYEKLIFLQGFKKY